MEGIVNKRRPMPDLYGTMSAPDAGPIICDLDGSLTSTDTLHESLLKFCREEKLHSIPSLAGSLRSGRSAFKKRIADRVIPDAATLPYNPQVLDYLRDARQQGRSVWLVTAADHRIAGAVAAHLEIFDRVIATNSMGDANLKGRHKLQAIQRELGADAPFTYIGDGRSDLPIWEGASERIGVFAGGKKPRWASNVSFDRVLPRSRRGRDLLKLMRPHQWLKNFLLFVPLILSHQLTAMDKWVSVTMGFIAFCCAASAVYVFNDLLDIEADRSHATKSSRPLAAGRVGIPAALACAAFLLIIALSVALAVSPAYLGIIVIYMMITSLYSYDLERRLLVDVLCLAALYALRIFAGGIAAEVEVSKWLLAFATFFFLSLGFAKRYAELFYEKDDAGSGKRRNYTPSDMPAVGQAGMACGMVSVLVFVLYLQDTAHEALYRRSELLWLVAPLMLYWVLRLWFHAFRGELHQDPVVFAATDRVTWLIGVLVAALMWFAT